MAIDKFDLAILMILQEDARASLQEISRRVGLSSTPCWTRIKRMETEGVIQGYTVRVDQRTRTIAYGLRLRAGGRGGDCEGGVHAAIVRPVGEKRLLIF